MIDKNFIKNQKGISAVMVLMIVTILSILSGTLIQTVFIDYENINRYDLSEKAYIAANQSIELWRREILLITKDKFLGDRKSIFTKYAPTPEEQKDFMESVLEGRIRPFLTNYVSTSKWHQQTQIIGKESVTTRMVLELVKIGYSEDYDYLRGTVGMYTVSEFKRGTISINNKRKYEEFQFDVKIPESMQLLGPLYSIGDLLINNGATVNVSGDINVFGTFPKALGDPTQNGYGGVYVRDGSTLTVLGNVYTRSALRTGQYLPEMIIDTPANYDYSKIWVYGDIVAQNIFAFGHGTKIYSSGNAYTYDDIEINGKDSVIAINGSYVGLESGGSIHDISSAIINSSIVHNVYSPDSTKSRIVVNGDVIIPGGVIRINTATGATEGKIEVAGLGLADADTNGSVDIPFYKFFDWNAYGGDAGAATTAYHSTPGGIVNSHIIDPGKLIGTSYLLLFQVFNKKSSAEMINWATAIDQARVLPEKNDTSKFDKVAPNAIKGFFNYEIAANNKLYFDGNPSADDDTIGTVNSGFFIPNRWKPSEIKIDLDNDGTIEHGMEEIKGYWANFWNINMSAYQTEIPRVIDNNSTDEYGQQFGLKQHLMSITQPMVERNIPSGMVTLGQNWEINDSEMLFQKALLATNKYHTGLTSSGNTNYFYVTANSENVRNLIGAKSDHNMPYALIFHNNPAGVLTVDSYFNGIIITNGRVILNGANIWGAIVSFGGSTSGTSIFKDFSNTASNDYGRIEPNNMGIQLTMVTQAIRDGLINNLDNGSYSGIIIQGSSTIDFYCGDTPTAIDPVTAMDTISFSDQTNFNKANWGRLNLLRHMRDSGIYLNHIF